MAKIIRRLSVERVVTAAIITFLIFSLGIVLGLLIDSQRVQWSERQSQQQKTDYESLQWQYLFLTSNQNLNQTCLLLHSAFEKSVTDLGSSLDKIQDYKKSSQINNADYDLIEQEYTLNNLKYWLLANEYKAECGADYVVVLYFFSEKSCSICPDQGTILTYYKKKYGDKLLVFPINIDIETRETSVKMLHSLYNLTELPSIVVGETKYSGVVNTQDLGKIICNDFINASSCID